MFSHVLRLPAAAIPMPRSATAPNPSKTPPKAPDPHPPGKVTLNDLKPTPIEVYISTVEEYSSTIICAVFDFSWSKIDLNAVLYFL